MEESIYKPSEASMESSFTKPKQDGFGGFDFGKCFDIANKAFKDQWGIATVAAVIYMPLMLVAAYSMALLIGFWLYPILMAGVSIHGLHIIRGNLTIGTIFAGFSKMGKSWLAVTWMGALIFLPMLPALFILGAGLFVDLVVRELPEPEAGMIVGIVALYISIFIMIPISMYIQSRLFIFIPLVLERDYSVKAAFKKSFEVTKEYKWWLMLYIWILGMVQQAGVVLCLIGVFVSTAYAATLRGAAMAQLLGEVEPENKP